MNIKQGKTYYFYNNDAVDSVCKAHVLHILPHPERGEDDRLIVYRWYGKHRQHWWYSITTMSQQERFGDYVQEVIEHRKKLRQCRKCGQCGYYMAYRKRDGTKGDYGDCASIGMNNECNEGNNHFKDPDVDLLQVESNDDPCGFFKAKRTRHTKEYIKEHPDIYYQETCFKPKPVR